jgi:hypothetical protein
MAANKYTIKAVEAILTCDLGVSPTIRESITNTRSIYLTCNLSWSFYTEKHSVLLITVTYI